jgi:hypothetical protein
MFMLITTLCLQLSPTDGDCRVEVQGVYAEPQGCRKRMEGQHGALLAVADDLGAKVLFLTVKCVKGKDA